MKRAPYFGCGFLKSTLFLGTQLQPQLSEYILHCVEGFHICTLMRSLRRVVIGALVNLVAPEIWHRLIWRMNLFPATDVPTVHAAYQAHSEWIHGHPRLVGRSSISNSETAYSGICHAVALPHGSLAHAQQCPEFPQASSKRISHPGIPS